jgi:hypothetical protein
MRRLTDHLAVPVVLTPTTSNAVQVPTGFIPVGARIFRVFNPNACCVWFVGTSNAADGTAPTAPNLAAVGKGWILGPFERDENPTQNPVFMSATPYDTPAYPIAGIATFLPLWLSWGE